MFGLLLIASTMTPRFRANLGLGIRVTYHNILVEINFKTPPVSLPNNQRP